MLLVSLPCFASSLCCLASPPSVWDRKELGGPLLLVPAGIMGARHILWGIHGEMAPCFGETSRQITFSPKPCLDSPISELEQLEGSYTIRNLPLRFSLNLNNRSEKKKKQNRAGTQTSLQKAQGAAAWGDFPVGHKVLLWGQTTGLCSTCHTAQLPCCHLSSHHSAL